MRRFRRHVRRKRRREKEFLDADPLGIAGDRFQRAQHQQRRDRGARPIGYLVEMKREPARQQHDLDRHDWNGAPADDPEQRQQRAREDVALRGAASRADRGARPAHVRRLDVVADHLQREISLHARAHVEIAVLNQGPAVMRALAAAQIGRDLGFQFRVDGLAEVMPHQDIFGGDGGVGLEFEHPMPIRTLDGQQGVGRSGNRVVQRSRRNLSGAR